MGKLNLSKAPHKTGSIYPGPFNSMMAGRSSLRLGDLGGLTQFGANMVILEPGAKSSLRHWHEQEDEFVMITQGTCTLIVGFVVDLDLHNCIESSSTSESQAISNSCFEAPPVSSETARNVLTLHSIQSAASASLYGQKTFRMLS